MPTQTKPTQALNAGHVWALNVFILAIIAATILAFALIPSTGSFQRNIIAECRHGVIEHVNRNGRVSYNYVTSAGSWRLEYATCPRYEGG